MSDLSNLSNLANLSNVTLNEIETKLMTILLNKQDQLLYDRYLYNILVDKFNYKFGAICPNFKNKFYMVLQSLDSNKGVKVMKNNDVYSVVYSDDSNKLDSYNSNSPIYENRSEFGNRHPNSEYFDIKYDPSTFSEYVASTYASTNNSTNVTPSRYQTVPEVIFTYKDIENGNTIYHDLVKSGSYEIIQKMFNSESMNLEVVNNYNLTPVDYINDIRVARLFIKDLYLKNKLANKKLVDKSNSIYELNLLIKKMNDDIKLTNKFVNNMILLYLLIVFISYIFKL